MVSFSKVMIITHSCHVHLVLKILSISISNPNRTSCLVVSKISIVKPRALICFLA